jgi:F420-dependent oxidoreductase-like protein
MRFSVWPDQRRPWQEIAAIADHAEATGWDGLYVYDHFMPNDPEDRVQDGPVLEGWTTLTAVAARTSRLRLGTLVLGNLYRHPAVVANMAATLDIVSDGRLVLGLGAGWQVNEHVAYGIELPPPGRRIDQFEEACAVVLGLLREERTTFHGTYYRLDDAACAPKPVQERLPLLVGGSGERRSIPAAARWADEWNAWTSLESFRRKSRVLDDACEAIGRDPSTVRRSTQALVQLLAPGDARPERDRQVLAGTPAQLVDVLGQYADAGLDEFILPDHVDMPLAERLELTERFRAEVALQVGR